MASTLLPLLFGFLPVLVFLLVLTLLDSYKLVPVSALALMLATGVIAGLVTLVLNRELIDLWPWEFRTFSRYLAPPIEELLKGVPLLLMIRSKRVGFLVDAVICGFALGAGFATLENIYYLRALPDASPLLWLIRGFGTAIMHGGVTATLGIVVKSQWDRHGARRRNFLQGWLVASVLHSVFNHFFLAPNVSTLLLLIFLPTFFVLVFRDSERRTRAWLGSGFDTDAELLEQINTGKVRDSRVGGYLEMLREHLGTEAVIDMICLLRLRLELSIRAKGILMMREAGFEPEPDPEIEAKFDELKHLEHAIGPTGLRAMAPIFHMSDRDLWQYHMVRGAS